MKKTLATLIIISSFFNSSLFAQIGIVQEINTSMSNGTNRGFKVLIPEAYQKETLKSWSKLMKNYNSKNEKIKKEIDYLSPDAQIPSLGEQSLDVYSQFQETPEGIYLNVFFDIGSSYINSDMHPKKAGAAKKLIASFATEVAKSSMETQLAEETKKLNKLDKELNNLEKDKTKYESDIQNAKETIAQREKDIEENLKNQDAKQKAIAEQKIEVDKVNTKLKKF